MSTSGDDTTGGVFDVVRESYDAVYDVLPQSDTFMRLWRENAYGGDFPPEFAHIGFLTLTEARRLLDLLQPSDTIVDVACGGGGPGLWMAKESGADLIGVDPSAAGLVTARQRAANTGLGERSRFQVGSFEQTELPDDTADVAMTIEAFQYAPDKRAALAEFARVLRPDGRVGIVCFEVDPAKAAGLPVLGVDPVPDYAPLLEAAGFVVEAYEETPGWEARVYAAFSAIVAASDALVAEMGEAAAAGAIAEATLTVEVKPYPRRVLLVARNTL